MIAPTEEYALLRDGGQVLIRPLAPEDRPMVAVFFDHLSPDSKAMRFHSGTASKAERGTARPSMLNRGGSPASFEDPVLSGGIEAANWADSAVLNVP